MSNDLVKVFNNNEFGQVRTLMIDGAPWFVGKDVASILGYTNTNKAIQVHVDIEDKFMRSQMGNEMGKLFTSLKEMYEVLGRQDNWLINESGLYSLIMSSKLPKVKEFKRWVTSEVLPTIRKTGSYGKLKELSAPQTLDSLFNIDSLYLIVSKLKEEHDGLKSEIAAKDVTIAEQNITIKQLETQVKNTLLIPETLEVPTDNGKLYCVTAIANEFKELNAVKLNKLLIEWEIQHKVGSHYEMCEGFDESKYVSYSTYKGVITQMRWKEAGRSLIHKRLLQEGYQFA